ncbi:MAG: hypothetical protein JXD21_06895 [Candidatus Omnitrophica bacterium]|nr:hypothetical protein [Candidatus Omnitrophota bacterium]
MRCSKCDEVIPWCEIRYKFSDNSILCGKCFSLWEKQAVQNYAEDKTVSQTGGGAEQGKETWHPIEVQQQNGGIYNVQLFCPVCGGEFDYETKFHERDKESHSTICPFCDRMFTFQIKKVPRYYYCDYCGEGFYNKEDANQHKLICGLKDILHR